MAPPKQLKLFQTMLFHTEDLHNYFYMEDLYELVEDLYELVEDLYDIGL